MTNQHDIIIVGSGVAGALCAWKLSQYGRYRILILEAGDNGVTHGQRIEFHHTMDVQGNRGDMYAPYMDLESRIFAPVAEKAQRELVDQRNDPKNYYDYTNATKDPFKAGYNRMVGGSTWSWRGNTPRFIPSDFKLKSNFGVGRDWPIDYHELEPWYCQAEDELGVSGNHEEWDGLHGGYRSRPFPMRGIPLGYADQQVKQRIEGKIARGMKIRVVTTPQARNSIDYDGRPACEGHSNCIPLCPIQAKYDATVHLRRVLKDPRVELRKAAVVTRLETGGDGRVSEVYYKNWRSDDPQKEHSVSADMVVLAAHAIETPKILLMSNDLANKSGQVGRNLMDHVQFEVIASFPVPLYPFRGPQSIASIEEFRDGAFRDTRSAFRMTIGNDGWGRTGSPATVIDKLLRSGNYGSALPPAIGDQIPKMLRLSFSTEMLAERGNRVELSTNKDVLGIPRPLFTFDVGDYTRLALREGFETAKELFGMMGATVVGEQTMPEGKWNTAAHIMGTCIMGDDPTNSVVDRWGRAHDVPNLWVVGSSVFPTSATANPTLTLAALSLRTAAAISRQMP
ncbi:GMC family oxidoreductase [Vineibacter terrae]|uniref:GMC family oxidoreductase n=1 Tax=Vineibacter terrae TaxID=2586908 RepID=A0A5C8PS60_9HYPH|nr:GMC family oxidoreductase [Vineibacter terrae]TXL79494.1 GMC family oxidoreductase [Vineibacter terrae]